MNMNDFPLFARCALEYLSCQSSADRSAQKLDNYIDHYAGAMSMECEKELREQCHAYARGRGWLPEAASLTRRAPTKGASMGM